MSVNVTPRSPRPGRPPLPWPRFRDAGGRSLAATWSIARIAGLYQTGFDRYATSRGSNFEGKFLGPYQRRIGQYAPLSRMCWPIRCSMLCISIGQSAYGIRDGFPNRCRVRPDASALSCPARMALSGPLSGLVPDLRHVATPNREADAPGRRVGTPTGKPTPPADASGCSLGFLAPGLATSCAPSVSYTHLTLPTKRIV